MNNLEKVDDFLSSPTSEVEESPIVFWDNHGRLDPRLARGSYSSSLLLHSCPRKFQLTKLQASMTEEQKEDWKSSLTFAFGHAVGDGIAETLVAKKSRDQIVFDMFNQWPCDLYDENEKQKKSFAHAVQALHKFWAMQEDGFFGDYEVAEYNGRPAAELSFRIWFPDGSSYRGYVDVVLRNIYTGEYVILENKTNSARAINHYQYKNSAQAIGYSVVLDKIHPGLASYTVEYLVYLTYLERWENFSFPKTYTQRALWVRDRIWEINILNELVREEGNYGIWPAHGESCAAYGRACDFIGMCHMDTNSLIAPLRESNLEEEFDNMDKPYDFEFKVEDLI